MSTNEHGTSEHHAQRLWEALGTLSTGLLGLAQVDDAHSQPMTAHFDAPGPLWFFAHATSRLAAPRGTAPATFHYAGKNHMLFACLHGDLSAETSRDVRERFWTDEVERWFPGGIDDPEVVMLRFDPRRAQVWLHEPGNDAAGHRWDTPPVDDRATVDLAG